MARSSYSASSVAPLHLKVTRSGLNDTLFVKLTRFPPVQKIATGNVGSPLNAETQAGSHSIQPITLQRRIS